MDVGGGGGVGAGGQRAAMAAGNGAPRQRAGSANETAPGLKCTQYVHPGRNGGGGGGGGGAPT
jgi:hypothetical protein